MFAALLGFLLVAAFSAPMATAAGSAPGAPVLMQTPGSTPNFAVFTASLDHSVVQNTVPLLTKYVLEILKGDGTVGASVDIGKPTPVAGEIQYTGVIALTANLPPANYTVRVAAEGPGGRTLSAVSAPFAVVVPAPRAPGAPATK